MFTEATFFQPPGRYQGATTNRLLKYLKLRLKNSLKYFLFAINLYKPRTSIHEVKDQVKAIIDLASIKADRLIWVQHRPAENNRIWLEKKFYNLFYRQVAASISENESKRLTFLELERDFLVPENYLMDGVHLSEQGHYVLAHRLAELIKAQE